MTKRAGRSNEFQRFLSKLKSGRAIAIPAAEVSRAELAAHVSREGQPVEVDQDAWWELLDLRPARWMSDSEFALAEGADCFQLLWEERDRFFVRQLTEAETDLFCRLAGVPRTE